MRPLSYSGMVTYEKCPSKFYRRYIAKEEVDESRQTTHPAASRGTAIHRSIELYLNKETEELAEDVEFYRDFFTSLRDKPHLIPEWRFAISPEWGTIGFTDDKAILRGVVDCTLFEPATEVVYVYEFKTGKKYADHARQRALYGLAGLCAYPNAKEALVFTMYLDQKKHDHAVFDAEAKSAYQWMWKHKIDDIWKEQEYVEQPSWMCKSCPYSERNGGTCKN